MLAGEILLFVMTFLVGLAAPILVIFYGLEVFVGAIQAFVFGALTLVFAMLAVASHGDGEHGHEEEPAGH
jgi:F-type H+-transporting ATPase subunit a